MILTAEKTNSVTGLPAAVLSSHLGFPTSGVAAGRRIKAA